MPTKIVVLSDTHATSLGRSRDRILREAEDSDYIVHAGDYTSISLVNDLREVGGFKGVHGNMDPASVRMELRDTETLSVEGFKIGITHPSEGGPPQGIKDRIKEKFEEVDAIIFGHTHSPENEEVGGILYFNPGMGGRTFGVLRVGEEIRGEIIEIW